MPGKNEDTDKRGDAQLRRNTMALAWCRLIVALGVTTAGLLVWLGDPPPGFFEGTVLMALAVLVGDSR